MMSWGGFLKGHQSQQRYLGGSKQPGPASAPFPTFTTSKGHFHVAPVSWSKISYSKHFITIKEKQLWLSIFCKLKGQASFGPGNVTKRNDDAVAVVSCIQCHCSHMGSFCRTGKMAFRVTFFFTKPKKGRFDL